MTRWLTAGALTGWGTSQSYPILAGGILGPAGIGGLAPRRAWSPAPRTSSSPRAGASASPRPRRPGTRRGGQDCAEFAAFVSAAGVASLFLIAVTILIAGESLLSFCFGPEFGKYADVAQLFALGCLIQSVGIGAILVLKTTKQPRALFHIASTTLVVASSRGRHAVARMGRDRRRARHRHREQHDGRGPGPRIPPHGPGARRLAVARWRTAGSRAARHEDDGGIAMNEAPLDIRGTLRIIRARWPVLVVCIVFGATLAFAYTVVFPTLATARSLVILPPSGQSTAGGPGRDMDTEVRIATSTDVLAHTGPRGPSGCRRAESSRSCRGHGAHGGHPRDRGPGRVDARGDRPRQRRGHELRRLLDNDVVEARGCAGHGAPSPGREADQ